MNCVPAALLLLSAAAPAGATALPPTQRPLAFVVNTGQTAPEVRYHVRARGMDAFFADEEVVLRPFVAECGDGIVRIVPVDPAPGAAYEAIDPLPGVSNHLVGPDPSAWRFEVPSWGRLVQRGTWPGIDVAYEGHEGRLERDVVVAPGGDPSLARFRYEGARSLSVGGDGSLVVATDSGTLVERPIVAWEEIAGARHDLDVRYVVDGLTVGFDVPPRTAGAVLVIDPVLDFSSFLGGSGEDVMSTGHHSAGRTRSLDFPERFAAFDGPIGGWDGYIAQVDVDTGMLLVSSYVGGSGDDAVVSGSHVNSALSARLFLNTTSPDLPVTAGALDATHNGGWDLYYLVVTGGTAEYATYVGGSGDDTMVAPMFGRTTSPDFPLELGDADARVTRPFVPHDADLSGPSDAFVGILLASVHDQYWRATYLGGSGD